MSKVNDEVLGIIEKLGDSAIHVKDLDVLGIPVPTSIEDVGAVGLLYGAYKAVSYFRENTFSKAFVQFKPNICLIHSINYR